MIQRTPVLSALWTLGMGAVLLVPALACRSGAPGGGEKGKASAPAPEEPGPAAGSSAPSPTTRAKPADAAVPSSGRYQPAPPAEPAAAPASSGPEEILPATKRSAAGLPDELTGYVSWFRLGPSPARDEAAGAHAPARRAYVLFPKQEEHVLGGAVKPPFEKGTTIVLEEKERGKDFISRLRTMAVEETGWRFQEYARDGGDNAFQPRTGAEAQCAACHAKAKDTDSVYAKLTLN